ncbi:hypothetical protein TRV_01316 [Trichophyton verrucosum HKI 0517]|uniref:DUF1754-domain-containing protein n=1 Tax=Trichophyton verrucosum (strain HKI 0517) TaxID=663202 RepID=D4D2L1_TRIVH|nr:uncharacterized protein TRV_01316 [Trichophyton verrucosum HKI 0517]EFE43875.1 hypothetical protein TRV_01316 [Trichophyton verrucosum HKI 0517]
MQLNLVEAKRFLPRLRCKKNQPGELNQVSAISEQAWLSAAYYTTVPPLLPSPSTQAMAPSSEYAVSGGGRLKIKGSKVQDGRVDKKKKKKKRDKEGDVAMRKEEGEEEEKADAAVGEASNAKEEKDRRSRSVSELLEGDDGKTEAERRHAEAKRKRLNERLKREGVKTHKERVEELNKYLSNLSEHHDM